jgi:hypothetical protein
MLQQRNLQRGLHNLQQEIYNTNNKQAAFLGKIRKPSPHLFAVPAHKWNASTSTESGPSFTVILKEKIQMLRHDEERLAKFRIHLDIEKSRDRLSLSPVSDKVHDNAKKVMCGEYSYDAQLEHMNTKVQDKERKAAHAQATRRKLLVSKKEVLAQELAERAQRHEKYAKERSLKEFQQAKSNWQRVVLPAVFAAVRVLVWSSELVQGREIRLQFERVKMANRMIRMFRISRTRRKILIEVAKRIFLRKRLWKLKMNQRIRLKAASCKKLMAFFRDVRQLKIAVRKTREFLYKVRYIQQKTRKVLAVRGAQLCGAMIQWDNIVQKRKAIQADSEKWGGASAGNSSLPPKVVATTKVNQSGVSAAEAAVILRPSEASGLIRTASIRFRASFKNKSMSFDKVNCSEMPPSSNVLVQGFLKQYLGEKRKVFAHVLDDYRKEYKTWLENKPFYEAETRARQLLAQDLAEAGETQSYTNLNRLGSIRDDEERGMETGSGPTGDHSSNSRSRSPSTLDVQERWGGTDDTNDSTTQRGWRQPDVCEEDVCEDDDMITSPVSAMDSPMSPLAGGSSPLRKKGSQIGQPISRIRRSSFPEQHGKAKCDYKDYNDYATWKAMPSVARYELIRYKQLGPPRPIFRFRLHETEDILPIMCQVRQLMTVGFGLDS